MANLFLYNSNFKNNTEKFKAHFNDVKELVLKDTNNIDTFFSDFVNDQIIKPYDRIFIPVSLGQVLSDFLGLRLAIHIRTTEGKARLANICLYASESLEEIASNCELFNILLTRGTSLIPYDYESVVLHLNKARELRDEKELVVELRSLKLNIPDNFFDSHSISNLWGMFRLCEVAGIDINDLSQLKHESTKLDNIYFKWLNSINNKNNLRTEIVEAAELSLKKSINLKFTGQKIDLTKIPKR